MNRILSPLTLVLGLGTLSVLGCGASTGDDPGTDPSSSGERGPLDFGKADSAGSCIGHCGGKSAGACWCDTECAKYGDCCEDIGAVCGLESGPVIAFGADFTETVSGTLTRGATVKIDYDASRLTDCRGTQNGYEQWGIVAHYRIDGGAFKSVGVAGNAAPSQSPLPSITLDHRGDLEMWFENVNRWGCIAYDSDYGANYHFVVE